ncbi:Ig-like domain repeat protein, partial [uncultured Methanobrevibacter sp.]|uniref:Ig-like domain repeat protein n=1 Tax=uncultured Methanobrevibacter sp. TaxID=253161 RepID=UPI0025E71063
MKFKNFLIIFALFMVLLCGVSAVSAASDNAVDNLTTGMDDSISVSNGENAVGVDNENSALNAQENNNGISGQSQLDDINSINENNQLSAQNGEILTIGTVKTIYVGHTNTTAGGDGSKDNPFTTFKAACDDVNGEDNVTIYVFGGEYRLGDGMESGIYTPLTFNTNNLNIVGLNGPVIIKNYFNTEKGGNAEAFSLTSSNANFTFSNLIFDYSEITYNFYYNANKLPKTAYFFPFYGGENNFGIYNNCSFENMGSKALFRYSNLYNSKFISCYFEKSEGFLYFEISNNISVFFENCIFNTLDTTLSNTYTMPFNIITLNNIWFGHNEGITIFLVKTQRVFHEDGSLYNEYSFPVSRYAVFNKTNFVVKYLGDNQYEIIGKLTWNGTDNQDGMENFQPMTVHLESENGGEFVNSTVTLVNGTFETIYKNSASNHHKITASLHNQDIPLEFYTVNITAKEANINYGDDQNITVNLSQAINSNVTIVVSNATDKLYSYSVKINGTDSFNFTIPDRLKAGTYNINITLNENNLYGIGTTTLTVSKVSDYKFEVIPSSNVKVGDTATINITLPDDVNGTVIVKFGNETRNSDANTTMTFNFTNLKAITYPINVTYGGSDKYTSNEVIDSITVGKADSIIEIENAAFTYGEVIAIPFNITNANGVTVSVLNKDDDEVATTSSASSIITLDTLPAGEYTLEVTTVVDADNYEWVTETCNLTINKADSTLEIFDKEFAYATEAVINAVTVNSTGNLIATLTDENNNEIPVTDVSGDNITLPLLDVGKYTLNVTTNVDENHNNITKSATITIIKTTPLMNVTVEPTQNITTKDNPTLTVKLPSDATGEVVIKVNGKKVKDDSANETITINLNNAPGDYVVDVIYSGDKNYESDSATKEFTISKAEISITANQTTFEEGNASTIEVTIPNINSGIVLVDVEGKKFYGDINNGKAIITLEGLPEGNYTANVKFFGDDIYNEATTTADVKVSEPKIITELKEQLEEAQANATQLKDNLDNVSGQLVDAQANATQLKEDLDELNQTVAGKDAEISNLTDVVAGKDAEISNLTDVVSGKDAEISNLTDVVSGKDA